MGDSLDSRSFRDALGTFATGVTIITSVGPKGEPIGVTANSFSSVSLDPPLVLFSLGKQAYSLRAFLSTHSFAVNVLAEGQQDLSNRFAEPSSDKWADVDYDTWETGCPILRDTLASFECDYRYTYDGGDHVIFVGEVKRMERREESSPLLFFGGGYRGLAREASAQGNAAESDGKTSARGSARRARA